MKATPTTALVMAEAGFLFELQPILPRIGALDAPARQASHRGQGWRSQPRRSSPCRGTGGSVARCNAELTPEARNG
jgi:hypothetical protein